MSIIKHIIIAILIGLIGYEVYQFLFGGGLQLPISATAISELLIFIAVAFSGTFFHKGASANAINREQGVVKWFNSRKGYGFITRDYGEDIFVHFRNIVGSDRKAIREGDRVSFIIISGDKGLQADEVQIA